MPVQHLPLLRILIEFISQNSDHPEDVKLLQQGFDRTLDAADDQLLEIWTAPGDCGVVLLTTLEDRFKAALTVAQRPIGTQVGPEVDEEVTAAREQLLNGRATKLGRTLKNLVKGSLKSPTIKRLEAALGVAPGMLPGDAPPFSQANCREKLNHALKPAADSDRCCRHPYIDLIMADLAQRRTRVVEIVGEGGIGKTSVAYFFRECLRRRRYRIAGEVLPIYAEFSLANQGRKDVDSAVDLIQPMAVEFLIAFANDERTDRLRDRTILDGCRAIDLARMLSRHGGVVVIDGAETLARQRGDWVEENFKLFLRDFCEQKPAPVKPAMVLLTSRWSLRTAALNHADSYCWRKISLERLEEAEAIQFLDKFRLQEEPSCAAHGINCRGTATDRTEALRYIANQLCSRVPIYLSLYGSGLAKSGIDAGGFVAAAINAPNPTVDGRDKLYSEGAEDVREQHREMLERYKRSFEAEFETDCNLQQNCLKVLRQLSIFTEANIDLVEFKLALWSHAPDLFVNVIRRLRTLALIDCDDTTISMHPELKRFFYEDRNSADTGETRQQERACDHQRIFQLQLRQLPKTVDVERSGYKEFKRFFSCIRHAAEAGLPWEAWQVIRRNELLDARSGPGMNAARGSALHQIHEAMLAADSQQLTKFYPEVKFELYIDLASCRTVTHGMADRVVREAYELALANAGQDFRKNFVAHTGVWRTTLVRGQLNELQSLTTGLRALIARERGADGSQDDGKAVFYSEVVANATDDGLFFTGSNYERIASFIPPETAEYAEIRLHMLKHFNVVYDPVLSQRLFQGWAYAMLDNKELAWRYVQEACADARAISSADRGAGLMLALYFCAAVGQYFDDRQAVRDWTAQLNEVAHGLHEVFLTHGGVFLEAWAAKDIPEDDRLTRMQTALRDWRATGAELVVPYFQTLLGEAYFLAERFPEARTFLAQARRAARVRSERWWLPQTLRYQARLALARGKKASAMRLARRAWRIACDQKAQFHMRRIEEDESIQPLLG